MCVYRHIFYVHAHYTREIIEYAAITRQTSQLHGVVVTCSGDDATSSQWRVDSVGIPGRIDV